MKWFFYNILFAVGYTLMLPKFLLRMWRRGGYRKGFMERLGYYSGDTLEKLQSRPRIWVHAVSVGEMFIALQFIRKLRAARPDIGFVLTTTTSTGHAIAEQRMDKADVLLYYPADFPGVIRRVLQQVNPRALVLTECELWPNLIRRAAACNVPVILVNGRISESSFRGYRSLKLFFREVMQCFSLLLVQTVREREMLLDIGARDDAIHVLGSTKYDAAERNPEGEAAARAWLASAGVAAGEPVIVGGSTWPGEEQILLAIFKRLRQNSPRLQLVLVPRHAERRSEIESAIREAGLDYWKRSDEAADPSGHPDVFLVDTTGELMGFYACASVIFVGKSLTEHGGQNMIEPALVGRPVIVGPHTENFPDVVPELLADGALLQVQDAAQLEQELAALLKDEDRRAKMGQVAGQVVRQKQGVLKKTVELTCGVLD